MAWTDDWLARIHARQAAGERLADIAAQLGLPRTRLDLALHHWRMRTRTPTVRRPWTCTELRQAHSLSRAGLTSAEIAARLSRSRHAVLYALSIGREGAA